MAEENNTSVPAEGHEGNQDPKNGSGEGHEGNEGRELTNAQLLEKIQELESRDVANQASISKLYKESKGRQSKLQEYEKKEADKKAEALASETDIDTVRTQLQGDMEQLKTEYGSEISYYNKIVRDLTVTNEIIKAAVKLNSVEPDDVVALLDRRIDLNIAKHSDGSHKTEISVKNPDGSNAMVSGIPMTIEQAVKALLDSKPHLVKGSNAQGSGGTSAGSTNAHFTPEQVKAMSRGEYEKNRQKILSKGGVRK